MSNQLSLNCWVFGEKADRIFPVKIAGTESVGTLKKAIKEENSIAFQHVDAVAIDLWQVSVPCFDVSRSTSDRRQVDLLADDSLQEAVRDLNLDDVKPLSSVKRLSGLYRGPPRRRPCSHRHSTSAKRCVIDSCNLDSSDN